MTSTVEEKVWVKAYQFVEYKNVTQAEFSTLKGQEEALARLTTAVQISEWVRIVDHAGWATVVTLSSGEWDEPYDEDMYGRYMGSDKDLYLRPEGALSQLGINYALEKFALYHPYEEFKETIYMDRADPYSVNICTEWDLISAYIAKNGDLFAMYTENTDGRRCVGHTVYKNGEELGGGPGETQVSLDHHQCPGYNLCCRGSRG
jgi:hypothetical protein